MYDANCTNLFFELTSQIQVDISLQIKHNYEELALGNFFKFTNSKFMEQFIRECC